METKRDTIILELIKYLVNSEKQLPQEMSRAVMYGSSESSGNAADVRELLRIQQQTNRKLDELKNSIESLYEQIRAIGGNNGNGTHHEPVSHAPAPTASPASDERTYRELIGEYIETAEEKLRSVLSGGLIARNHAEFFLRSGHRKNHIALFYLQAENNAVSWQVLSLIGSEAVLNLNPESDKPSDMLLQINRTVTEYALRHPLLLQKLRAAVCLIDKRQAKVLFAGAGINLIQTDEEGLHVYEGNKSWMGASPSLPAEHTANIRRGTSFFLYGGNVSNELDKLLKKLSEESPQEKKAQLTKWLTKKNSSEVIIGFSF